VKKLKLDLDGIQVVSFAAETAGRDGGTVNAHATPAIAFEGTALGASCNSCPPYYCPPMPATARC